MAATALEMVRRMQAKLRLQQAERVTEPHAKLMLECLNNAQRNLLPEAYVWDELKIYGEFDTEYNNAIYAITGVNDCEIDVVRSLRIGSYGELTKLQDSEFRDYKAYQGGNLGMPICYRHYAREGGSLIIEVCPTPDKTYTISVEALIKPKKLVNDSDEIMLDEDTLFLAAMFLATEAEGLDYQAALSLFQSKYSLIGNNQGESNWGDMIEAI